MSGPLVYPRFAQPRLLEALSDSPVVLLHGPRQCGKTTLAQLAGQPLGYAYFTFDDPATLAAAGSDPVGFVDSLPERVVLDEVQQVPELFAVLKMAVDRRRIPGRFLVTGSSNVLLLPRLADSLAGRMAILRLHPLSQSELCGKEPQFLERLFSGSLTAARYPRLRDELPEKIAAGGFPAALMRQLGQRRSAWYRDYVETLVQRDVRDLARISSLDAVPRLLALAASQTAHLLNVTSLAASFQLSRPTIRDYVTLLERVFLLEELPPWHGNRLSRLVKTPKLHVGDTGVAATLLGLDGPALGKDRETLGQLLETFVFGELRRQASWAEREIRFHHFRDKDGTEVDLVLERGIDEIVGVEVKASATVRGQDFRGLRKLKERAGQRFRGGALLYDGENLVGFGEKLYAVPIRALWELS